MSKHANSVTGYNVSEQHFPAFTPVALGRRLTASGISDDICFMVSRENIINVKIIGITACDMPPGMPGKVITSGIANTLLPDFFDSGDRIAPDENGNWVYSNTGSVTVIAPADDDGIGTVFIGSRIPEVKNYRGHFRVENISEDDILKVEVYGGQTDLGTVMNKVLNISESTSIYLMAEYIHTDDKNGYYRQTVTIDPGNDRTSDEYALWLIADVSVREHSGGAKYLEIVQQWQSGAIYWGSRYWI